MRTLYTLLFAALSFGAFSQNNSIHVYPWNPDANQDNEIGMDDLLSFLSVFGEEFGLPPEPCTYDGTELEAFWSGIVNGAIVLDSLFMEFLLVDSAEIFFAGCPDPIVEVVEIAVTEMMTNILFNEATPFNSSAFVCRSDDNNLTWMFAYSGSNGVYNNIIMYSPLHSQGYYADGLFGTYQGWLQGDGYNLPFPEEWFMDENGIHLDTGWGANDWPYYATYFHILPYWHYADE